MILNKYYKVFQSGLVSVCFSILVAPLSWVWIGNFEFSGENWKISKSHNVIRDIISSSVLAKILLEIYIFGEMDQLWANRWLISGTETCCFEVIQHLKKNSKFPIQISTTQSCQNAWIKKRSKMISNNNVRYKMWINDNSDHIAGFWYFSCLVQNTKFPIQKRSLHCWKNIWYHVFLLLIK